MFNIQISNIYNFIVNNEILNIYNTNSLSHSFMTLVHIVGFISYIQNQKFLMPLKNNFC